MSSIRCFVSPRLPTALADRESVDVPGQDLWLMLTSHAYIVPTRLDISTFEDALSRTLQLYPHAAGKLRRSHECWSVELTNTPVPVDIEYKPDVTSDTLLNGNWVAQEDLSPFISHSPIKYLPVDDDNAHLISLKLIFFDHETSVGLNWHHSLGDGSLVFRFMHTLSQFYQDLPLKYAPPTFEKYHFPAPSASMMANFAPYLPGFHHTWLISESDWQGDLQKPYKSLKWQFDNDDLLKLRSVLSSRAWDNSNLSKQDCLTAYMVAVLNHHLSEPTKTVTNICSYRSISAPFIFENVGGNMIHQVTTTVPKDMTGIATAVRKALIQHREPAYIHDLMSVSSDILLKVTNAGMGATSNDRDDTLVIVNSHVMIDWRSAHFGYPNGTRFFKPESPKHNLKCYRSNPTKGDDGVWWESQSVDVTFAVRAELQPKLLETLARGFQYILDIEDTEL